MIWKKARGNISFPTYFVIPVTKINTKNIESPCQLSSALHFTQGREKEKMERRLGGKILPRHKNIHLRLGALYHTV